MPFVPLQESCHQLLRAQQDVLCASLGHDTLREFTFSKRSRHPILLSILSILWGESFFFHNSLICATSSNKTMIDQVTRMPGMPNH